MRLADVRATPCLTVEWMKGGIVVHFCLLYVTDDPTEADRLRL